MLFQPQIVHRLASGFGMTGLIKDATGGSFTFGLMVIALGPIMSVTIVLALGHDRRLEHIPAREAPARR